MSGFYDNIIVGTDGSATAQCAVAVAVSLALAEGCPLKLAAVWTRDVGGLDPESSVADHNESAARQEALWAEEVVSDAAGVARAAGAEVIVETPVGEPAEALTTLGEQSGEALIVVGTVGLDSPAERLLGNIPHKLTHHAHDDLFLVSRRDCAGPVQWNSVALATDGSDTSIIAVQHGLDLANRLGATPTLVTVAKSEKAGAASLDKVTDRLTGTANLERHILIGSDPAELLISEAHIYDVLVLGNKGMSGAGRLLGSVPNTITHNVPTDLLLVNTTRKK